MTQFRLPSGARWGAEPDGDRARCRLWAPAQERVGLALPAAGPDAVLPMLAAGDGWFEITTDALCPGDPYAFELADGMRVPDPASRAQSGDVHGPSLLVDPHGYLWHSDGWRGRPWHEAVIYELHVGTFSPEGTFEGVMRRLDHLAGLGVTALELMPVAQFSGRRGWGYDGVLPYAPHNAYGSPDDLRRLVDAAHERGLMVLLDVVYNHFGPEGNYLHLYAPQVFTSDRQTPWGAAIDYTREAVRAFAIDNAIYWLDAFRFDGLRLDAIDQIADPSETHILEELARTVRQRFPDRHIHLTTEDSSNRTVLHERDPAGRPCLYTAEWNDDIHHAAHVAATGECEGYYADYQTPAGQLARGLAQGFVYQGEPSPNWQGRPRGEPSGHLPPVAFIDFIQNHDQTGNRAFGERLTRLAEPDAVAALLAILLTSPHIPLLFMGEEWGETRPFQFFTDFTGDLADAVRDGRRREFAGWAAFDDPESRARIPDPNALSTFETSKLDWRAGETPAGRARLALVKRLLAFRNAEIVPRLNGVRGHTALAHDNDGALIHVAWRLADGATLSLWANVSDRAIEPGQSIAPLASGAGRPLGSLAVPDGAEEELRSGRMPGWSVVIRIDAADEVDDRSDAGGAAPSDLDRLSEAHGIATSFVSETGEPRFVSAAGRRALLAALGVDAVDDDAVRASLAEVPAEGSRPPSEPHAAAGGSRCFVPAWLERGRAWGISCQLYGLKSARNWGIGDFADLVALGHEAAARGADFLGVQPLHALFLSAPKRHSPYAPSSRRFLNPLYIAIDWLDDSPAEPEDLANFRDASLVDYAGVTRAKLAALRDAFAAFRDKDLRTSSEEAGSFTRFCDERGEPLRDFTRYETIASVLGRRNGCPMPGWTVWPDEFQDKTSAAVADLARDHAAEVQFHAWLQWVAGRQLERVQASLREAGMRIGLYLDIAVGVAPDGAETWTSPSATLAGTRVGAPADLFNPDGQDWGLAPLSPRGLRGGDTTLFRGVLEQNMHAAGAIRIDHVMALERLYLIPEGLPTRDGAYVSYPREELVETLAGVSQATGTIVVGEDLGTVRPGFRDVLRRAEIQSYRVLPFERGENGGFRPPSRWPVAALACASTHDLATIKGWWDASDLDVRAQLGLLDENAHAEALRERERDRSRLVAALTEAGILKSGHAPVGPNTAAIAIHRFIARTPARLMAVQLEDMLGEAAQANVPGTVDEHPNWRRRMPLSIEDLANHELFTAIANAVAAERPRQRKLRDVRATYRLQLRDGMTFDRAAGLVPHLARLGISHLYLSPIFTATPGSTHGYDVTDPTTLDESLGGAAGFETLAQALNDHRLGLVVDIVPNHMAMTASAPWFRDVLTWGSDSPFASHFDIDWSAPRLLLPVLPEPYGRLLASGEFSVRFDEAGVTFEWVASGLQLPLAPRSYALILVRMEGQRAAQLKRAFACARPDRAQVLRDELAQGLADPGFLSNIHQVAAAISDEPSSLHEIHEAQPWRLTHWRAARDTLTHRRFFEITDLIGLTVERRETFRGVHERVLALVADGRIDGLRIDHIDGLAEPTSYLRDLQAALPADRVIPVWVEKILEPGERLRTDWPIAGTTGYEFIATLAGLFVDPAGEAALTRAYETFTGATFDPDAVVADAKREIIEHNLAAERDALARRACAIAADDLSARDIGADTMRRAIGAVAAAFPVYRTYADADGLAPADKAVLENAVRDAHAAGDPEDATAVEFVASLLMLDPCPPHREADRMSFVIRFQQFTGPVMAKAVEDTAFYRLNRLIALNEVGGAPHAFGAPLEAFHAAMAERATTQPAGLSATATHDTKRGEDARARIYGLSQMPAAWDEAVARWAQENAGLRGEAGNRQPVPSRDAEWLFYQSLLGCWPADLGADDGARLAELAERMAAFMLKAAREAKQETTWTRPSPAYEEALERFVRGALDPARSSAFLADFEEATRPLRRAGAVTSLAQCLVKLTAPGVPDIYQGSEGWDFSLVDPDNRRAPDFDAIAASALPRAGDGGIDTLLASWRDGGIKQLMLREGLAVRAAEPALFSKGVYRPLRLAGPRSDDFLAFARVGVGQAFPSDGPTHAPPPCALTIVPRRALRQLVENDDRPVLSTEAVKDTSLVLPDACANARWHDALSARTIRASEGRIGLVDALAVLPVALLLPAAGGE